MQKKTCIIIPCYNEAKRLQRDNFVSYAKRNRNIYLLFVNDGSKDETGLILQNMMRHENHKIFVLDLKHNVGKAEAVRLGILESFHWKCFDYVGYFDADLSCPLTEIKVVIKIIERIKACRMVLGSRVKRLGAEIERNELRHYIGRVVSTLASIILKLPVYDTQCGFKLFTKDYAQYVFSWKFKTTWLFDCEILARLIHKYGYEQVNKSIYEVPLNTWIEKGKSKIKFDYVFKIPIELYNIHKIINNGDM